MKREMSHEDIAYWLRHGEPVLSEQDAADGAAAASVRAIRMIPVPEFTERVCMALISSIQARMATANWMHTDHAQQADEYLTDAHLVIENAADEISREATQ